MSRGMNIVILDAAGNYLMSRNFDTADPVHGRGEGEKMAQFLDDLPSERMVCVSSLEATGICEFRSRHRIRFKQKGNSRQHLRCFGNAKFSARMHGKQ